LKLGLCLSGGGARGAYQIGVCQALKEHGLFDKVNAFSGTSIGAANAVMLSCLDIDKVKRIWFNMPKNVLHKAEGYFKRIRNEKGKLFRNGIYQIDKLEEIIKKYIDFDKLREKEVYITLSDCGQKDGGIISLIKSSYLHYIRRNKLVVYSPLQEETDDHIIQQILASCSIPVVFPAVNIEGKQYYDGGLYDNVPVKPLIDAGCDKIIVIELDKLPYLYKRKYKDTEFHIIRSSKSLGMHLKFNDDQSKIRYHMGYEDCMKYLETNKII